MTSVPRSFFLFLSLLSVVFLYLLRSVLNGMLCFFKVFLVLFLSFVSFIVFSVLFFDIFSFRSVLNVVLLLFFSSWGTYLLFSA